MTAGVEALVVIIGFLACMALGWSLRSAIIPRARRHLKYIVGFCVALAIEALFTQFTGWSDFVRSVAIAVAAMLTVWYLEERTWFRSPYEKQRLP